MTGRNFADTPGLACSFGGAEMTNASLIDSSRVRCATPAASAPGAEVESDEALLTSSKIVPGQARGRWWSVALE